MLTIRRSRDRLIFNMGIPIPVRQHLYIETAPRRIYFTADVIHVTHWCNKLHLPLNDLFPSASTFSVTLQNFYHHHIYKTTVYLRSVFVSSFTRAWVSGEHTDIDYAANRRRLFKYEMAMRIGLLRGYSNYHFITDTLSHIDSGSKESVLRGFYMFLVGNLNQLWNWCIIDVFYKSRSQWRVPSMSLVRYD